MSTEVVDAKTSAPVRPPAFGSVLTQIMSVAWFRDDHWGAEKLETTGPLPLHPAAHALHYGSSCFEGFKAYRRRDGGIHVFRLEQHIERFRESARALLMPEPDAAQVKRMVLGLVDRCRRDVPDAPGSLYLRPVLFGTAANIGSASQPTTEACLVVLASPVWDYFAGGMKPLRIYIEPNARTAPHLGVVKTGGNYAAALGPTLNARRDYRADQVLFCPNGEVQETGAANFLLIREKHILTRSLDSTFLHGVTRDSLLTLARDLGYEVSERIFDIAETLRWITDGEAALSGTAAVLTGVGTLIYQGRDYRVGSGEVGPCTLALRKALMDVQRGDTPDKFGWLTPV